MTQDGGKAQQGHQQTLHLKRATDYNIQGGSVVQHQATVETAASTALPQVPFREQSFSLASDLYLPSDLLADVRYHKVELSIQRLMNSALSRYYIPILSMVGARILTH